MHRQLDEIIRYLNLQNILPEIESIKGPDNFKSDSFYISKLFSNSILMILKIFDKILPFVFQIVL